MEPRWSDRRTRPVPRRDAVRSAGAWTGPDRAWRAAVPPPGCRSPDGRRWGPGAAPRPPGRAAEPARADPGRAAVVERAAGSGRREVAGDPAVVVRGRGAGLRGTSRWAGGPGRRRRLEPGVRVGGSGGRRADLRNRVVRGGAVLRHSVVARDPLDARGGPLAHRGAAHHPHVAGPSAHCPPGRPDPGPSAARGWRAAPAAVADGTPSRRPFRGILPRDTAPTVRDLRALMIARADRHPLMNLAFPQLAADATVLERLRGIPQ